MGLLILTVPMDCAAADNGAGPAAEADRADIHAALRGDEAAYARLVRRYEQMIGQYMWRFTRDRGVCEELVHDVFVEAYFSLRRFRGEAPFEHWLRKIATRVGYRYWKRRAKERARPEVSLDAMAVEAPGPADAIDPGWAAEAMHAALAELPPRDRLVLTLRFFEGLSVADAAQAAGWSQAMVKVQTYRARSKLRRVLEQHGWSM